MNKILATLGLFTFLLTGCATTPTIDYDTAYNFNLPKTYSWVVSDARLSSNPAVASDLLNTRLEHAIDAQMQARGYQKVDAEGDLSVTYHIQTQELERSYNNTVGIGDVHYRGRHSGTTIAIGGISSTSKTTDSDFVDVTVNLTDRASESLVWQSKANEKLLNLDSPEKSIERSNEVAELLFSRFPN